MKSKSKSHLIKKKIVNKRGVLTTVLVNPEKEGVISAVHSAVKGLMSWLSKLRSGDEKVVKGVSVKKVGDDAYKLRSVDGHDLHHGTFTRVEAANHLHKLSEDEEHHKRVSRHAKHRHEAKQPLRHRIARFLATHGGNKSKATDRAKAQAKDIANALKHVDHKHARKHADTIISHVSNQDITHHDLAKHIINSAQKMAKQIKGHVEARSNTVKLSHYLNIDSSKFDKAFGHLDLDKMETHVDAALKVLDYLKERSNIKRRVSVGSVLGSGKATIRRPRGERPRGKFPFSRSELVKIVDGLTHLAGLDEEHAKSYTMMFDKVTSSIPTSGLGTITDDTLIDTSEPVPYKSDNNKRGVLPTDDELRLMAKLTIKVPTEFIARFNVLDSDPDPYKTGGFTIAKNGRFIDVTEPDGRSVRMPGNMPDAVEQAARFVRLRYDQLGGREGAKARRLTKQKETSDRVLDFKRLVDDAPKADDGTSIIGDHHVGISSDGNYYVDGLNIGKNPEVADRLVLINRSVGGYEYASSKDLIAEGKALVSGVNKNKSKLTVAISDKDKDTIESTAKDILFAQYRIAAIRKQLNDRKKSASSKTSLKDVTDMLSGMGKGQAYKDSPPEPTSMTIDGVKVERLINTFTVSGLKVYHPDNAAVVHNIARSYVGREYEVGSRDITKLKSEVENLRKELTSAHYDFGKKSYSDGVDGAVNEAHKFFDIRGRLASSEKALSDVESDLSDDVERKDKPAGKLKTVRLRDGRRVPAKKVSQLSSGDVVYDSFAKERVIESVVRSGKRFVVQYSGGKSSNFKGSMYIGVKNG